MKLISWNVNGLRSSVKNGFAQALAEMKPDILCLQEIKIDHIAIAKHQFEFLGYEAYWNPAERRGYSGTAILSRVKPLAVINDLPDEKLNGEGRVQTLELERFYLINTYFPNSQPELARLKFKQDFNHGILEYIKKLEKKKPVVICGDFNVAREPIDLANPKANDGSPGYSQPERDDAAKFIKHGLIDSFRFLHPTTVKYSWWTYRFGARAKNVGWRIDYFFVSKKLQASVKSAEIYNEVEGSDHCPVGLVLK